MPVNPERRRRRPTFDHGDAQAGQLRAVLQARRSVHLQPSCPDGRAGRRSDAVAIRLVGEHAPPTVTDGGRASRLRLAVGYGVGDELDVIGCDGVVDDLLKLPRLTVEKRRQLVLTQEAVTLGRHELALTSA